MELRKYLSDFVPKEGREAFARECGTTENYLNMMSCGAKPISPKFAVAIEKATGGRVPCEESCPGFDWAYLRKNCQQEETDTPLGADAPATTAAKQAA
jgi:DNA-binding transcriptional regulator YdaS (Cro superfamily)